MDVAGSGTFLTYLQIRNLLRIEFARARRYEFPLSCLVLRVDRLDHLKDLHGPRVRDQIFDGLLKHVIGQSRICDLVGRHGDRFLLILPHTDRPGAMVVAERLRAKASSMSFPVRHQEVSVTTSIGVATLDNDHSALFYDSILKNAEFAAANASERGGDHVEYYDANEADPSG